jgi:hypothetical protein
VRRLPCILAFTVLLACTGSAKRESSALQEAVDRYRSADDTAKAAPTEGVRQVACSDAAVCEAKRACLGGAEATTRALALKDEALLRLGDLEHHVMGPDDPAVQALPAKLDEASRLLDEGRAKMADCERRLADLHLRYGR